MNELINFSFGEEGTDSGETWEGVLNVQLIK